VNLRATWLALALVAPACRIARPSDARTLAEPVTASIPESGAAFAVGATRPIDTDGMPSLTVVLQDPRLAAARESEDQGDAGAAAREVDRVRAAASLDAEQRCAWSYVAGRLHFAAGESTEAAAAFDSAACATRPDGDRDGGSIAGADADAGSSWSLASYARLREAQALVRAGRPSEALASLHAVGADLAAQDEAKLASADALVELGNRAAAVPVWRSLLASRPHGLRWVDTSIQLARALLDGVDGPAESNAKEALDLATRVVVEVPMVVDRVGADALRTRAAVALRRTDAPPLTADERAREAQAWLDASKPGPARALADGVLRDIPRGDRAHADAACRAATVRAQATPRGNAADAADAWGVAIGRCQIVSEDDLRATALYQGGRASASAKRFAEALDRFAEVEKAFPTHRLADDARFRAALVVDDQGDSGRSLSMLASIADAYPEGDMAGDALFRVALARIEGRDWAAARTVLDRLLAWRPGALSWGSAGRAGYFRARTAQLAGDVEDAKARYVEIVAHRPLSYFMLAAYSRLLALDDALARSTIEAAVRREPGGPFLTERHPELEGASFDVFARLLEVGEIDAARQEASAAGLSSDDVDPEVVWTLAWSYDRAGAPGMGHAFARARLVDYRSHWPAGRWRLAWQVAFPRPWDAAVLRESESTGIPPPLTWAIMREESAFDPEARSAASAVGLMQLMAATARKVSKGTPFASDEAALRRPDVSIALGARLLSSLRASFPGRPDLAIAAYNAGAVAVHRWLTEHGSDDVDVFIERIGFDETRNYVKRVLASQAAYAYLYAPASLDELTAMFQGPGGSPDVAVPVSSSVVDPIGAPVTADPPTLATDQAPLEPVTADLPALAEGQAPGSTSIGGGR
jgi:soluble lytic murein transglycosylase